MFILCDEQLHTIKIDLITVCVVLSAKKYLKKFCTDPEATIYHCCESFDEKWVYIESFIHVVTQSGNNIFCIYMVDQKCQWHFIKRTGCFGQSCSHMVLLLGFTKKYLDYRVIQNRYFSAPRSFKALKMVLTKHLCSFH